MIKHPLNPQQPLQLALFDLDGTLVDSAPDLAEAVDRMLLDLGLAKAGEERVRSWVGNGALMLVKRALAHASQEQVPRLAECRIQQGLESFLAHYDRCCTQLTRLYPGVESLLRHWHGAGVRLAVVTNKPTRFTPKILQHCRVDDLFCQVVSGDTLPKRKPAPDPLLLVLRQQCIAAPNALMVGDSRNDVEAARAANIAVAAFRHGYNHGEPIEAAGADLVIDSLNDLISG